MTAPQLTTFIQGVSAVSADNLNTFEQTCNNVADLRQLTGTIGMQVFVRGFVVPNDGGEGPFYWSPSATGPDDNATVIVPIGSAVGAWLRIGKLPVPPSQVQNIVTPLLYGALGDGQKFFGANATGTTLSIPGYIFTAADVGKSIALLPAAALSTATNYFGFIQSVAGGTAQIAPALTSPMVNVEADLATDDTAAIQAMAADVNANNLVVDWLGLIYQIANPGIVFNNVRVITFTNSMHIGNRATLWTANSNVNIDTGNMIAMVPANGVVTVNDLTIDGQYVNRGTPQFNYQGLRVVNATKAYLRVNITRTAATGLLIANCGDVKVDGNISFCSDDLFVQTPPTDSQLGRQFGILADDNYGHLDISGIVISNIAQSGILAQTTHKTATINWRGSRMFNCSYYCYDIERFAGICDMSGGQAANDPLAVRDYSHTMGGMVISDTSVRICDSYTSIGCNGNDFVTLCDDPDTNKFFSALYDNLNLIGSGPTPAALFYMGHTNNANTWKVNIGSLYTELAVFYIVGPDQNRTPYFMSTMVTVQNLRISGRASVGTSYNTAIGSFGGGTAWVSILSGWLGRLSVENHQQVAGAILADLRQGVEWSHITNAGLNGALVTDLSKPITSGVQDFSAGAKDAFPFDNSLNTFAHAPFNTSEQAAQLQNVATSNVPTLSVALDQGRYYLVAPAIKSAGSSQIFIGDASNITTGPLLVLQSSTEYLRYYQLTDDFVSRPSPDQLAFGCPTYLPATPPISCYVQDLEIWEFFPVGSAGLAGRGRYASDREGIYGSRLNAIRVNDT